MRSKGEVPVDAQSNDEHPSANQNKKSAKKRRIPTTSSVDQPDNLPTSSSSSSQPFSDPDTFRPTKRPFSTDVASLKTLVEPPQPPPSTTTFDQSVVPEVANKSFMDTTTATTSSDLSNDNRKISNLLTSNDQHHPAPVDTRPSNSNDASDATGKDFSHQHTRNGSYTLDDYVPPLGQQQSGALSPPPNLDPAPTESQQKPSEDRNSDTFPLHTVQPQPSISQPQLALDTGGQVTLPGFKSMYGNISFAANDGLHTSATGRPLWSSDPAFHQHHWHLQNHLAFRHSGQGIAIPYLSSVPVPPPITPDLYRNRDFYDSQAETSRTHSARDPQETTTYSNGEANPHDSGFDPAPSDFEHNGASSFTQSCHESESPAKLMTERVRVNTGPTIALDVLENEKTRRILQERAAGGMQAPPTPSSTPRLGQGAEWNPVRADHQHAILATGEQQHPRSVSANVGGTYGLGISGVTGPTFHANDDATHRGSHLSNREAITSTLNYSAQTLPPSQLMYGQMYTPNTGPSATLARAPIPPQNGYGANQSARHQIESAQFYRILEQMDEGTLVRSLERCRAMYYAPAASMFERDDAKRKFDMVVSRLQSLHHQRVQRDQMLQAASVHTYVAGGSGMPEGYVQDGPSHHMTQEVGLYRQSHSSAPGSAAPSSSTFAGSPISENTSCPLQDTPETEPMRGSVSPAFTQGLEAAASRESSMVMGVPPHNPEKSQTSTLVEGTSRRTRGKKARSLVAIAIAPTSADGSPAFETADDNASRFSVDTESSFSESAFGNSLGIGTKAQTSALTLGVQTKHGSTMTLPVPSEDGIFRRGDLIFPNEWRKDENHHAYLTLELTSQKLTDVTYGWSAIDCQQERRLIHLTSSVDVDTQTAKISLSPVELHQYAPRLDELPYIYGAVISIVFAERVSGEAGPDAPIYWVTYSDVLKACQAALNSGPRESGARLIHIKRGADPRSRLRAALDELEWVDVKRKGGSTEHTNFFFKAIRYDSPKLVDGSPRSLKVCKWLDLKPALEAALARVLLHYDNSAALYNTSSLLRDHARTPSIK